MKPPKTYHINFYQKFHLRNLIMSIQVIYFHTHGHPWHPQCIHMITLPPLLHHPQVFFYLQLLVWHTEFSHQEIILYQLLLLLTTPVDTPCYQPILKIHILQVIHNILHRSPYLIQEHPGDLQTLFKELTQQMLTDLHQSVHLFLTSLMFNQK